MFLNTENSALLAVFLIPEILVFLYFWRKKEAKVNLLDFIMLASLPNAFLLSLLLVGFGSEELVLKGASGSLIALGMLGLVGLVTLLFVITERTTIRHWILSETLAVNRKGLRKIAIFLGKVILLFSVFVPSICCLLLPINEIVRIFALLTIIGQIIMFERR